MKPILRCCPSSNTFLHEYGHLFHWPFPNHLSLGAAGRGYVSVAPLVFLHVVLDSCYLLTRLANILQIGHQVLMDVPGHMCPRKKMEKSTAGVSPTGTVALILRGSGQHLNEQVMAGSGTSDGPVLPTLPTLFHRS